MKVLLSRVIVVLVILCVLYIVISTPTYDGDEVVVARFNENIDNLGELTNGKKVTVYNKGPNKPKNYKNAIQLPNVGGDAHTYLYHIVNRYDSLAPRTVFITGSVYSIEERRRTRLEPLLEKLKTHKDSEFSMCCGDTPNLSLDAYDFQIDTYEKTSPENKSILNETKLAPSPERPFGKWYEVNFGKYHSRKICYVPNFAVTREDIRRKPKSYYENLLTKYMSDAIHPEAAHYIERAWHAVFYS